MGAANISYKLPVTKDIEARCSLPQDGTFEAFIEQLKRGERARIELTAEILVEKGVAVRYTGRYSAHV